MDADGQHATQVTSKGPSKGYGFVEFELIDGRTGKINGRTSKIDGRTWEIDGRTLEINGR